MKIKEYAADVVEYTEVVDAPYNFSGSEEVLDERPMGFVKGGLQKLGAKVLPGSYGDRMQGKVEVGKEANQLYKEFNIFLGKTGYQSSDDAIKAFLKQKGINVNIDSILKQVAPAPAAPQAAPAPTPETVAESVDHLDRILILSGRTPKNMINETKTVKKKKVLNEAVALNRGALNKIFMQVAQQMSGGPGGEPAAGGGGAPPANGNNAPANSPAPAAGGSSAPAASGSNFGGDGPSPAPAAGTNAPPVEPPAAGAPANSPAPAAGGGIINKIKNAFKGKPAANGSDATANNAPQQEPPAAGAPTNTPAPAAGAPTNTPTPAAGGGKLGGTNPGAAAAKAAGSQKQSTQNMNDYVKNVSAQINAVQSKPEKIELAKELINFMSDRKGSPEYDNAMGSAKAVLKKAGLNNMLAPLAGGQTASQKPQGLRNPPAAPKAAPKAQPAAAAPAPQPAAAPRAGFKVGADELNSRRKKNQQDANNLSMMKAARGLAEDDSRVLHRNSYIFIKKVLENTDLTLRDLGYRVSISESTSDSVTLITR